MSRLKFADFQIVGADGRPYMTGALPRTTACGGIEGSKVWAGLECCPKLARADWIDQPEWRGYEWADENQASNPSCTLTSLANDAEFYLARTGRAKTRLDWLKAWKTLSGGYGGVALDAALRYVMTEGYPLLDGTGVLIAVEVWDLPDIDAFFSALQREQGAWYGASSHAEFAATTKKSSAGKFSAHIRGSWGRDYGDGGWYERSEAYIAEGIPTYGAFCIREWELRTIDL